MSQSEYDGSFVKKFKKYDETRIYNDYEELEIMFDSSFLELDSVTDIHEIMQEINKLSYRIFYYGSLCDSQNRVVQQLEDEFDRWKAEIFFNEKIDDKQYKSEKSKERHIFNKYSKEFIAFQNALSTEKYKLSMLQRVVKSLEGYGYKLHDLKDYNLAIEKNS